MKKEKFPVLKRGSVLAAIAAKTKGCGTAYIMILPFFLLFFVFTIIPVVMSLPLAFTSFDMVQSPKFVGFENFYSLFLEDEIFITAIQNTIIFAAVTGPIAYIACFVLAWLIQQLPYVLKTFFTFAFYAPTLAGNIYTTWQYIFSGDTYGVANSYLMDLNIISGPVAWLTDSKYISGVIILVQLWMSLGAGFLAIRAGLQGVPRERYEAGAIEGIKGRGQEMIHITIPAMGPQLLFAAVVQIATCFAAGDVGRYLTDMPTTDYKAHTLMSHAYDYGQVRYEMGYAAAICFVLFLCMLLANWGIRKVLKKYMDE